MYYTCEHPEKFLPEVTEALTAFEDRLVRQQGTVVAIANTLYAAGRPDLAGVYLTDYSRQSGLDGLRLGNALLAGIEARTEAIFGLRSPGSETMSRRFNDRVDCLP